MEAHSQGKDVPESARITSRSLWWTAWGYKVLGCKDWFGVPHIPSEPLLVSKHFLSSSECHRASLNSCYFQPHLLVHSAQAWVAPAAILSGITRWWNMIYKFWTGANRLVEFSVISWMGRDQIGCKNFPLLYRLLFMVGQKWFQRWYQVYLLALNVLYTDQIGFRFRWLLQRKINFGLQWLWSFTLKDVLSGWI